MEVIWADEGVETVVMSVQVEGDSTGRLQGEQEERGKGRRKMVSFDSTELVSATSPRLSPGREDAHGVPSPLMNLAPPMKGP